MCGKEAEIERPGTARQSMIIVCTNCGCRMESGDVVGLTPPEQYAWNVRAGGRQPAMSKTPQPSTLASATGYAHPTTIQEFESVYRKEYEGEIESCDRWIKWCANQSDQYGVNFHQGMKSAHIFNNIKMEQLLRVLKQEAPNAASGHNAPHELPAH